MLILDKINSLQHMKTIQEYNFKVEVTSDIIVYITLVKNDYSEDRGDIGFREQNLLGTRQGKQLRVGIRY